MTFLITPIYLISATFLLGLIIAFFIHKFRKGDPGSLHPSQVQADYPFSHFNFLESEINKKLIN